MSAAQREFIRGQIHSMTLMATVQRAGIYAATAVEGERAAFRAGLRFVLDDCARSYEQQVSDDQHLECIVGVAKRITEHHGAALRDDRLRIGAAQKALHLFLKYLWCVGWIPMPPQCPFDRRVIAELPAQAGVNWTELDDPKAYNALVVEARNLAGKVPLALWELELYNKFIAGRGGAAQ